MTGGRTTQLAFQYQNLFSILKIIEELKNGNLIKAQVEQPVNLKIKEEIDLTLSLKDNHMEYYEIKSGKTFTSHKKEIKKNITKLFNKFLDVCSNSRFFILVHQDYRKKIYEFIEMIQKISNYKKLRKTENFNKLCNELEINIPDNIKFFNFCKLLKIVPGNTDLGIIGEVTNIIKEIFQDQSDPIIINVDHALSNDDLINRLNSFIKRSLRNNNGNIDLVKFSEEMIDWGTKNLIAYKTGQNQDVQKMLKEERENITKKLNIKFPSVPLLEQETDITKEHKKYEGD